jgi:hypothetical protein
LPQLLFSQSYVSGKELLTPEVCRIDEIEFQAGFAKCSGQVSSSWFSLTYFLFIAQNKLLRINLFSVFLASDGRSFFALVCIAEAAAGAPFAHKNGWQTGQTGRLKKERNRKHRYRDVQAIR